MGVTLKLEYLNMNTFNLLSDSSTGGKCGWLFAKTKKSLREKMCIRVTLNFAEWETDGDGAFVFYKCLGKREFNLYE